MPVAAPKEIFDQEWTARNYTRWKESALKVDRTRVGFTGFADRQFVKACPVFSLITNVACIALMQDELTRLEFRDRLGEGCANMVGIPGGHHPIRQIP